MTEKYCAFLRGINVNGRKMKMSDLSDLFVSLGFSEVSTVLATGNILFTAPESRTKQELKRMIESELSRQLHDEAHVFIRGKKELATIHSDAQSIPVPKNCHNYLILFDEKSLRAELSQLFHSLMPRPPEQFLIKGNEAFWIVPKGSTLSSAFGSEILGSKKYKSQLTSRNINTIEKVHKRLFT